MSRIFTKGEILHVKKLVIVSENDAQSLDWWIEPEMPLHFLEYHKDGRLIVYCYKFHELFLIPVEYLQC